MSDKISVIVPVYNTEIEYLKFCIESVLNQDYRDVELLLVNDGSKNEAPNVIDEYAEKDARVIAIHQENQGVSVARNHGLEKATGDYVIFVDGDDFLSEGILSRLVQRMRKSEVDLILFGYCTSYTNREMNRVLQNPDPALFEKSVLQLAVLQGDKRLGPVEVGAPWGKLIRRSIIEDNHVRYTPGLVKGQDTVFTLHLLEHCDRITYDPVCGYHYRISTMSVSHRYNPKIVDIMEKTLGAYDDFVKKTGKDAVFQRAVGQKYYRVLTGEYLELYYLNDKVTLSAKECRAEYAKLIDRSPYKESLDLLKDFDFSLLGRMEYGMVRGKHLRLLWIYRKLLQIARRFVVKNYH